MAGWSPVGCLRWALLLLAAGRGHEATAQLDGANAGSAPGTYFLSSQLPDEPRPPKRIYFPPDPPPLGAQINFDRRWPTTANAPIGLAEHVTEPFYAPLSTCLGYSALLPDELRLRLKTYTMSREQLLAELRGTISNLAAASAAERVAAFAALAQRQAAALTQLEAQAEALRVAMARKANWYARRKWKFGAGALRERKLEHRLLEFQLVRAAAFYQPGLSPPQRRLLREAAMMLQDEMSAAADPGPGRPPPLWFFMPDLVRVLPRPDMPAVLTERLEVLVAAKDALRAELVDAILAGDRARFAFERQNALARLAAAQADRLAALELQAEEIRREYATAFESHRQRPPPTLPGSLLARIETRLAERATLQAVLTVRLYRATELARSTYRGNDPRELNDLEVQARHEAMERFAEWHEPKLREQDAQLEQLHVELVACVGEAALPTEGGSPCDALQEFMANYRTSYGYCEYEIAVFQAGLSAAQRRLLVGGAVRWLDLPLPRAEFQPTDLPRTLLNEEQKLAVVGVR